MTVSLTLWLGYSQLMIKQSLSLLVMRMLITLSDWSMSLLLIGTDVMLLIFAICRAVSTWFAVTITLLHGNRLDLVITDVPDIEDVFVGTPLGTSDHCFVSCVLRVEQSIPEYNIRSTVFLKHRANWDNVRCAVRSFTWSTILKSADPLMAFDRAIGEVIGKLLVFCVVDLETSNDLMPAAGELMTLSRLLIMPGVEHAGLIIGVDLCLVMLRPRGSMVQHGSHIMNTPGIL